MLNIIDDINNDRYDCIEILSYTSSYSPHDMYYNTITGLKHTCFGFVTEIGKGTDDGNGG